MEYGIKLVQPYKQGRNVTNKCNKWLRPEPWQSSNKAKADNKGCKAESMSDEGFTTCVH